MTPALRLGLYYSAIFLGTGAVAPYMPIWFAARGLSGAEIGLILSAPMTLASFSTMNFVSFSEVVFRFVEGICGRVGEGGSRPV